LPLGTFSSASPPPPPLEPFNSFKSLNESTLGLNLPLTRRPNVSRSDRRDRRPSRRLSADGEVEDDGESAEEEERSAAAAVAPLSEAE
jgi:predicted component of type VI protein secretion system